MVENGCRGVMEGKYHAKPTLKDEVHLRYGNV